MVFESASPDSATTAVREMATPEPGPDQITIDVEFAGINFLDILARRGEPGYVDVWPFRPGYEVAGTVSAIGSTVSRFKLGDRVAAFTHGGGLAEVVIAEQGLSSGIPPGISSSDAATAPITLSTALLLLKDLGHLGHGESVLMHSAAGGVGNAVAWIARHLGAGDLLATVGSSEKVESARRGGWTQVFVRDGLGGPLSADSIRDDIDLILDPLGTQQLEFDMAHVGPGGRIVIFGNAGGADLAPLPPVGALMTGGASISGLSMRSLSTTAPHRILRALQDALAMLDRGGPRMPLQIVDSLDAVAAVHDRIARGESVGKYVVRVERAERRVVNENSSSQHHSSKGSHV